MYHNKKWICGNPDVNKVKELAGKMGISKLLAMVLINRGIDSKEKAEVFLYPEPGQLADPFLMPDMEVSVERIIHALDRGERICIYGDYDVDGITSVSLLIKVLSAAGANVSYYIPDRMEEGYGLNAKSVREIREAGTGLMITVDCGIASHEEIMLCNAMGMDVIVTDHHQCQQELPSALGVINPKRSDSPYPFSELAGVGVVYKLCTALETMQRKCVSGMPPVKPLSDGMLDLVALGTVADIVPLTGENRVLVSLGLERMAATGNIGFKSLIRVAGIKDGPINPGQVAFALAPRLNAAGRLSDAQKGVQLLLSEDEGEALLLARELDQRNRERQNMENKIYESALEMAEEGDKSSIFVLASDKWHPGVIGIAASRLVERYNRPAILFSIDGGEARGSARSIPGLDMFGLLSTCRHYYKSFGGHKQAAGLTLETDKLEEFAREINAAAEVALKDMEIRPVIRADADLTGVRIAAEDAASLKLLEPCGCGNPSPLFVKRRVGVAGTKRVGKSKEHLKLIVNEGGKRFDCIAFRWTDTCRPVAGQRPDIVFCPQVNSWLGREDLQLVVKDIKNLSTEDAFLEGWYNSILDLERHGVLVRDKDMELSGVDIVKTDCGYAYLKDVFGSSTGNLVLVNGYADVLDAFSTLMLNSDAEVRFGRAKVCSGDKNIIVVHPYDLDGMEGFNGKLFFFAHSILPAQFKALGRLKGIERMMLVDHNAVSLGLELNSLLPDRETSVTIYSYIRGKGNLTFNELLGMALKKGISPATVVLAVESLMACDLIETRDGYLALRPAPQHKVNLQDAPPYRIVQTMAFIANSGYDAVKKSMNDV